MWNLPCAQGLLWGLRSFDPSIQTRQDLSYGIHVEMPVCSKEDVFELN
jgi:hypothetical protein